MLSIYHEISGFVESGRPVVLCTIVSTQGSTPRHEGSKMLVYQDGKTMGTIGGGEVEQLVIEAALSALKAEQVQTIKYSLVSPDQGDPGICGGQLEVFIEPILPKNKLIVIGGGHVGKEVAFLGKWLGFNVVVFDDRPEYSNPEAVPDADEYYSGDIDNLITNIKLNPWTYFVLTTRDVEFDLTILPFLLDQDLAYIGVIGSKRRWETTKENLIENGIQEDKINKVFSPIGLEINAETPREIAISILSEIVKIHRGNKTRVHLSNRQM